MVLNAVVIGTGVWGRNHARVYASLNNVNLFGVVDQDEKRAQEIGKFYQTNYYTNVDEILQNPEIDLISVCTPTVTHSDIAAAALKMGKNVLVEKPMTNTISEAKTLIRLAEENNVKLTVGFVERFNPAVQEALKHIKQGTIGDVILANTRRVSRRPLRIGDVGVVKDLAIHDIDIIAQMFPNSPETIYATCGSIAHKFEDYANINVRYKGNRNAFIETNWLTPSVKRDLTITGTEGVITVQYRTQQITIENNERLIQPYLPTQEPLRNELAAFVDCILNDTDPIVTGANGLKALTIAEAALESSRTGKTVNYSDFLNSN
jgi:UDP-N-acetylglucosamine 3-dehydrogenase